MLPKPETFEKKKKLKEKISRIWSKKTLKIENNFSPEKSIKKSFKKKKSWGKMKWKLKEESHICVKKRKRLSEDKLEFIKVMPSHLHKRLRRLTIKKYAFASSR